jgi:hypothetical protein
VRPGAPRASGMPPLDSALFEAGAPLGLQRRLGLVSGSDLRVGRRAALVVLIGWVPLVLLTIVQSTIMHTDGIGSLLLGLEAHARYLVAAPLLIFAETQCAVRLSVIIRHFVDTGVVPGHQRERFDAAIASTRRLLGSTSVEIAVVVFAYLITAAIVWSTPIDQVPAWHRSAGIVPTYSPAGWWHVVVSLPLLIILFLGWIWRLVTWTGLLRLISRLQLRLVASHPDHAAGLGFVGHSVRAFAIVALAPMAIAAGKSARIVLTAGNLPTSQLLFNIVMLTFVAALITAPLLVFTPTLIQVWRRAVFEYGALADRMGAAFEDKWLRRDQPADPNILEQPDFSATTDLYAVVANIYDMRFIPIDLRSIAILVAVMLLPFVPVLLLAVPIDQILSGLKGLLF